jgi:hypothetical protein
VLVRREEGGARLSLITRDGRRAERRVEAPEELAPTLAALRVTVDAGETNETDETRDGEPAKPPPPVPVLAAKSADHPATDGGASKAPSGPEETGDRNATLFALTAGMRGGGADSLFSPVLTGAVSLLRSRWEFGVIGAVDARYRSFDSGDSPSRGGTISAGIFLGRREPAGNVELLAGARLSVAAIFYDENVDGPAPGGPAAPPQEPQHGGPAEGRVGAYVGAAFPRRSSVRFRADIVGDAVVGSSPPAPITPDWALSALAGVELRAL